MVHFSPELWSIMALIAAACGLAILYFIAAAVDHERRALDLRVRAAELRNRYERQLRGEPAEPIEVLEVTEPQVAPLVPPAPSRLAA